MCYERTASATTNTTPAPATMSRVEAAQARINELEAKIEALENELNTAEDALTEAEEAEEREAQEAQEAADNAMAAATAAATAPVSGPGYIVVRVGKLPGKIEEIALNGGRTVAHALEGAELRADGMDIRVNGVPSDVNRELVAGDTVLLVKKIRGNCTERPAVAAAPAYPAGDPGYITVRVGKLPGKIAEIALNGGRTVQHALEGAELSAAGMEIRVNGVPSDSSRSLVQGDTVLLVKKIRGNC